MNVSILATFVGFLIFGQKVSVVDFAVLCPCLLLPVIRPAKWCLPRPFLGLTHALLILLVYQLVVQGVQGGGGYEVPGRLLRALVMTLVVGVFYGGSDGYQGEKIMRLLVLILLVHSLLVIGAAQFMPLNEILGALSGNDRIRPFRSSGLVAGFDMAGLLSIMGAAMLIFDPRPNRRSDTLLVTLLVGVHFVACYFASRVSVVVCGMLFWYQLTRTTVSRSNSIWMRAVIVLLLAAPVFYLVKQIVLILDVTMSLGLLDVDKDTVAAIVAQHAVQDPDSLLWSDMIFVPHSVWKTLIGVGFDPTNSDVGYVKEIFRYGVVGLITALAAHLWFVMTSVAEARRAGVVRSATLVVFALSMMFLLSAKNNYVFVRGFFPLLLLIVGAVSDVRRVWPSTTVGGFVAGS